MNVTDPNITLLSHGGRAHVGIVTDQAAVRDGPRLTRHLAAGFDPVCEG